MSGNAGVGLPLREGMQQPAWALQELGQRVDGWLSIHLLVIRHHAAACAEGHRPNFADNALGAEGEPPLSRKQRSRAVGFRTRLAEGRAAGRARAAAPATRHEDEHDVIADGEIGHALAERLDDSRRLMAERALSRCQGKNATFHDLSGCQAAATAVRHVVIAAARSARCVWAERRWRWTLKVL